MNTHSRPGALFYVIVIIFLLWNLLGLAFFFTEMFASDMIVENMNNEQRLMYENRPAWYMGNYAVAVFCGVFACIALLFKRRFAVIVALLSFIAIIISTFYNITIGAWKMVETADKVSFALVPVSGLLLLVYTWSVRKKGWLK